MKILILESKEQAVQLTAASVLQAVRSNPRCVLGLATGGTMLEVYQRIVEEVLAGDIDVSDIKTFNLDEYVGIEPDHAASYHTYMRRHLFGPLGLQGSKTRLPRGNAKDPNDEARDYEAAIRAAGGIDLQLLGVGTNGHIGFNEPSSSLASRTRLKTLARSTREANKAYFAQTEDVPRMAITMGVGTILDSRKCLVLATGAGKATAVKNMIEGPVSAACPASALQMHARTTVVLDKAAAEALAGLEYYREIHSSEELCV